VTELGHATVIPTIPLQNGSGFALVVFLLLMAGFVAVVYWVYKDAQRNSQHPAFLWAIVVFLAPLLGLLLYVLLGRNDTRPRGRSTQF
jgi:apolipoprotein N-acyltransferase